MTSEGFKEARRKLGLSAAQLGAILDSDPRTIRRWEDDASTSGRPQNPIACRVLEWMRDALPSIKSAVGKWARSAR